MPNCVHLDLNIPPLKNTIYIDFLKTKPLFLLPKEYINVDLINFLRDHGTDASHIMSFYSSPNYIQSIHIDILGGDISKLNFVYGGAGSTMQWYSEKSNTNVVAKKTEVGSIYKEFSIDQVELIESHQIGFPSLVQVGIPHNIINYNEPRLCISIILEGKTKTFPRSYLPMELAIEKFKNYIK